MADSKDVAALQALASTLTDSVNGYQEAADAVEDTGIKNYLHEKAQLRQGLVEQFRQHIAQQGGSTEVSGSASAAAHRAFLDLRTMFQDSTKAAVAEVERGESYLKDRFESYMSDDSVSPDVRSMISNAYSQARFDNTTWDQLVQNYR